MKPPLLGVVAVVFALTAVAVAGPVGPSGDDGEVLYLGQLYCVQMQWCPAFAFYGTGTPIGYVELTEPDGTPSTYLWVDYQGSLNFEASPLNIPPPPGLPLLGKLVADGTLQEIDQFFPAGRSRPLFIQDGTDDRLAPQSSTPEPSTLLLFTSAAGLAYGCVRHWWRA
jgi:hypothetical protein